MLKSCGWLTSLRWLHLVQLALTYLQLKTKTSTAFSYSCFCSLTNGNSTRLLRSYSPEVRLACHHFIDVGGGVIDSDFRGEMIVIMFNYSNKHYKVRVDDRIAQMVFHCYEIPNFVSCVELSKTDRGLGGFSSVGT